MAGACKLWTKRVEGRRRLGKKPYSTWIDHRLKDDGKTMSLTTLCSVLRGKKGTRKANQAWKEKRKNCRKG